MNWLTMAGSIGAGVAAATAAVATSWYWLLPSVYVVPERHVLVKQTGGQTIVKPPGRYFYWTWRSVVTLVPTHRIVVDLPRLDLVTKDRQSVSFNPSIEFEIDDPRTAIVDWNDYLVALRQRACESIIKSATQIDFDVLIEGGGLTKEMFEECRALLEPVGVKVYRLLTTGIMPVRGLRIIGNDDFDSDTDE